MLDEAVVGTGVVWGSGSSVNTAESDRPTPHLDGHPCTINGAICSETARPFPFGIVRWAISVPGKKWEL